MLLFEIVIALLAGSVLLTILAKRLGLPSPMMLALGGAALAFLPGLPTIALEPDLALALFVAPVLLDAAFDSSVRDVRENLFAILGLAIGAVLFTTAAVAVLVHWLLPEAGWAMAIAIGAIVAPPDAAAAIPVLRQMPLPYRLTIVLEGESLINDAAALLTYRVAVAAAGGSALAGLVPGLAVAIPLSLLAGPAFAWLFARLTRPIEDAQGNIVLQLCGTFAVWIIAERVGLSGILTIVSYAVAAAWTAPSRMPARLRVPSYAVWEVTTYVLTVLAFVLVGLQLRPILEDRSGIELAQNLGIALAVLATVVVARLIWLAVLHAGLVAIHKEREADQPDWGSALVAGWCGMRGIVTLAAALALPNLPHRDLAILTAFVVVLGTLVLQGASLRPLVRWLDLPRDDPTDREIAGARTKVFAAALGTLDGAPGPMADVLRQELQALKRHARETLDPDTDEGPMPMQDLRLKAISAGRDKLAELRRNGRLGERAFQAVEQDLDSAELSAADRTI